MRARLPILALSLLALAVGSARASTDPYRDQAEKIPCPAAPAGWSNPPESAGGRAILTPLTAVAQTDDPTYLFGAPVVQVDCHYRTATGKDLQLSVRYALPIDLNPYNDFYVGCTSTGHPQSVATAAHAWNDRQRIYRVVGKSTWSLATFIDDLDELGNRDVPRFEAMTKAMLKAAQPFAHDCKLAGNGKPVALKSIWSFSFDVKTASAGVTSRARTSGSFFTIATSGSSVGAITNLAADDFHLKLTGKGKTRWLSIHVGTPIEFRHGSGVVLRTHVLVTASTDAACRRGAAGTLLVSIQSGVGAPRVAVHVCGHTYLDGKGRVSAAIKTV